MKRGAISKRVRLMLTTSDCEPREIAIICRCSYQLVTKLRRELRVPSEHDTLARRVAMLDQDVRDLRRLVTHLMRSSQSYDNPSSAVVPRPEMDQMR